MEEDSYSGEEEYLEEIEGMERIEYRDGAIKCEAGSYSDMFTTAILEEARIDESKHDFPPFPLAEYALLHPFEVLNEKNFGNYELHISCKMIIREGNLEALRKLLDYYDSRKGDLILHFPRIREYLLKYCSNRDLALEFQKYGLLEYIRARISTDNLVELISKGALSI